MTSPILTRKRPVTLKDVAARAEVNVASVSAVLNGSKLNTSIAESTRARIVQAASELGYQANAHAQSLALGGRSNTLALLSGMDLGIATQKIWAIQHAFRESGFEVELHGKPRFSSQAAEHQTALLQRLRRQNPRAIIFTPFGLEQSALDELRAYQEGGGTLLCFDADSPLECDVVLFDEENCAWQATHHVLQLGHRKVGFCLHGGGWDEPSSRTKGFSTALREAGIEPPQDWCFSHCCYEAGGATLAQQFLELRERPTALCIVNDVMAASFVHTLLRAGLRVPHDVSVVGQDGLPAAEHCVVPLTTVSEPLESIGDAAFELLSSRLDNRYAGPPRRIVIKGKLIVRQSAAALS